MDRSSDPGSLPPIDADGLFHAMTAGDDFRGFIDLETGEVELIPPIESEELDEELESFFAQPDRFIEVERVETREQYRWMCEFAASLTDAPDVAQMLEVALDGRGAFGRFRNVLAGHPDLRERWNVWEARQLLDVAQAWLERRGIERALAIPHALAEPAANTKPSTAQQPEIGLVHVLLLGAPDGKTELLGGRVLRRVDAGSSKRAQGLLRRLVRDACALHAIAYRRSLVDGRDELEIGELGFRRHASVVEIAVAVDSATWRQFG